MWGGAMQVGRSDGLLRGVAGVTSKVATQEGHAGKGAGAARPGPEAKPATIATSNTRTALRMQPNAVFSGAGPRR